VVVELLAGGFNKVGGPANSIPHDLAHYVVEDEFEFSGGLWGTLAAGGLFAPSNTKVIAGRQRPHAGRVAREIVQAADETLKQAEILVRAVADLALANRFRDLDGFAAATGSRWFLQGVTAAQLERACQRLQADAATWRDLAIGEHVDVSWLLA
jgi:hypothetical protein